MATQPQPWYRASKDAWFVQHRGKQVRLAKGEGAQPEAMKAFYKLMAGEVPQEARNGEITVARLCDLFLEWSKTHHEPATYSWHRTYLDQFCNCRNAGRAKVSAIRPFDVTRWLDDHPEWTGAARSAVQIVKRAFSWGEQQGLIAANPIRKLKVPAGRSRERFLSAGERQEILAAVNDPAFRNFLIAVQESGCRPSEVARVTGEQVDLELGIWTFAKHKTAKKTKSVRTVYLSPVLFELTKKLMDQNPSGPLFRNARGQAFTRNAIVCRFRRLQEKLPHLGRVQVSLYRHSYITDALEKGVPVAQVATLVGHTSTEMIMRKYSKLSQRVAHMREAAALVTAPKPDRGAA